MSMKLELAILKYMQQVEELNVPAAEIDRTFPLDSNHKVAPLTVLGYSITQP
jgi:hypothetical protein